MAVSVIVKDENGIVINEAVADVVLVRGLKYLSPSCDGPEIARSIIDVVGEIRGWAIPRLLIEGTADLIKDIVKQATGKNDIDMEKAIMEGVIEEILSEREE